VTPEFFEQRVYREEGRRGGADCREMLPDGWTTEGCFLRAVHREACAARLASR
jgi:hypothetical protein